MMRYRVACDQSYTRCGFAVVNERLEIIEALSMAFPKGTKKCPALTKKEKRHMIVDTIKALVKKYDAECVIVERVRQHSSRTRADGSKKTFMSAVVIHALVMIIGAIIDGVDVPIQSIDTRSWKSKALGNASASKEDAAFWVSKMLGKDVDHDAADAALMGIASFNRQVSLAIED